MHSNRLCIKDEYGLDPLTPAIDGCLRARYFVWRIPAAYAYRPGAISARFFGSVEYAKVLMLYNGLCSAHDFVPNTAIRIPIKSDLDAVDAQSLNTVVDVNATGFEGEIVEI